jgi:hypothetical protein
MFFEDMLRRETSEGDRHNLRRVPGAAQSLKKPIRKTFGTPADKWDLGRGNQMVRQVPQPCTFIRPGGDGHTAVTRYPERVASW